MDDRDLQYQKYKSILENYLQEQSEQTLYKGQQFSRKMIEQKISPEEAVSLHVSVLEELFPDIPQRLKNSYDFLLEMMIGYGFAYREHQSLRSRQQQLESEIEIAANMQQTLLAGDKPDVKGLDIGAISKPAQKMSGDYYHFVQDENNCMSVAIADVIGKGIPAALCMSMIKYTMDSAPEQRMQPGAVLENLNRVVEQNVDPNMFITMFYGLYDPRVHSFYYAGAGHEPGFFYDAEKDEFEELYTKGLVLGVSKKTSYQEYQRVLYGNDMVIMLSDGVTECRSSSGFIERDEIVAMIRKYIHLSAQEIVDEVYRELERLQEFELRDDFTLVILRREV
ncbi:PP2C family protein-serine/threonine phosphatase [Guptibacillus hwajinpoensis]|uniref:Phosphoserine phosphatase n=1 Tax=Guptibacillus hwajinpoensis TaxID=208199 RepID=A0A0J6CJC4_9BACL|nr:PP2C family protein-serine/threonine phosphatase [Alkalihalobacillus macyae]KMM36306.1 phosphoserine phosphatase [Alkalihalobacillus macyae]MDP4553261.1 PP2C family protein-serine/threonine phosphatase [Alkalihalobacillus macyae]